MSTENNLSSRLKELRKQKNLTQNALGEALDLSRELLSNYEQGRREPDFATLIQLANFFGVSVDYLIGHSDILVDNIELNDMENEMVRVFRTLSVEQQEIVIEQARVFLKFK